MGRQWLLYSFGDSPGAYVVSARSTGEGSHSYYVDVERLDYVSYRNIFLLGENRGAYKVIKPTMRSPGTHAIVPINEWMGRCVHSVFEVKGWVNSSAHRCVGASKGGG